MLSNRLGSILLIYISSGQEQSKTSSSENTRQQTTSQNSRWGDDSHPVSSYTERQVEKGNWMLPQEEVVAVDANGFLLLLSPLRGPVWSMYRDTSGSGEHGARCKLLWEEEKQHFSQLNSCQPELKFMNSLSLWPKAEFSCICGLMKRST